MLIPPPSLIEVNGVRLSTLVAGSGPTVLLAHGFPELAYSWRHQVPALVAAGYGVVVPDMRGYGASSRPAGATAYDLLELVRDMIGLLDAVGAAEAVLVGHDWGAPVAWTTAVRHPSRVRAVVGLSVPHGRPAPAPPSEILRRRHGEDFYMLWYQEPGRAEYVLSADVRRTLTGFFAEAPGFLRALVADPVLPDWITEAELQVYVDSFEQTGFGGGLSYYRNLDRNWLEARRHDHHVTQPAMFATGENDVVRSFQPSDAIAESCTALRADVVVPGAGHWLQQERPQEINSLLLSFLRELD